MATPTSVDGRRGSADEAPRAQEQMRAREPDTTGFVSRDGVRTYYEVYGAGSPTILLLPSWAIVHSRIWKAQIPFLARHGAVITFDPRGNGRSDRPLDPIAYAEQEYAADAIAVLDATGTDAAIVVGISMGARRATILGAEHPERVSGLVILGPSVPIGRPDPRRLAESIDFEEKRSDYDGWARVNRHSWRLDYRGYLEFFMGKMLPEPHSTKQLEDMVGWGLETDPETLLATADAPDLETAEFLELCARVRCPSMVIVGSDDHITGIDRGRELARVLGSQLEILDGAGHVPQARQPVRVNLLIREFARRVMASPPAGEI